MGLRLSTAIPAYVAPAARAVPDTTAFARAAAERMPSHLDALDAISGAFNPATNLDAATRLRTIADVGDLPIGIRPVGPAGTTDGRTGLRIEAETDDAFWAPATTNLRALADDVESGDAAAGVLAQAMLFGHSYRAMPEDRLAITMRFLATERQLALLPARLPGPLAPAAPSVLLTKPDAELARYAPTGQLAFGSEAAQQAIDATHALGGSLDARRRSPIERARVLDVLTNGTDAPDVPRSSVGDGWNINGSLPVRTFALEGSNDATVAAVIKSGDDAPFEAFAGRLAARVGADHLVPATVIDRNGFARIELRDGMQAADVDVTASPALERSMAGGYLRQLPMADDDQVHALARHDAQLMRAFDYVLANVDRHTGNVLVDEHGRGTWIDHGLIGGRGYRRTPVLEPFPRVLSLDGSDKRELLDPSVAGQLQRTLDHGRLASDFRRTVGLDTVEQRSMLEGMLARLHHAQEQGELRWS